MSERRQGHSRLVVRDKRIVSVDEAKAEAAAEPTYIDGKRARPPGDFMQGLVTRQEMMDHLAEAAMAMGQKMYNQFGDETQEYLQEMETALREEIRAEFERRTILGKVRNAWQWLTRESALSGWLMEIGVTSPVPDGPQLVVEADAAAVDALDPSTVAVAPEPNA